MNASFAFCFCHHVFYQVCFHLSEEIHQVALHRTPLHSRNQSNAFGSPPSAPPPPSVSPDSKLWWFSDPEMNRHGQHHFTALCCTVAPLVYHIRILSDCNTMISDFFIASTHAGPFSFSDLKEYVISNLLNEESLVWTKGMPEWKVQFICKCSLNTVNSNTRFKCRKLPICRN